jgi:hypothetical protein
VILVRVSGIKLTILQEQMHQLKTAAISLLQGSEGSGVVYSINVMYEIN